MLLVKGYIGIVAPLTLIFYGLALVNASKYTLTEVKSLGIIQIILCLVANIKTGRINYYGVHKEYRREGLGQSLFNEVLSKSEKDIPLLNVSSEDYSSSELFKKLVLKVKINQYEMTFTL